MTTPARMPASFDLSGRTALVTGAGRGLGRAIVTALAAAGADVVLVARTAEQLDEVAGIVRSTGRRSRSIEADLGRPDAAEAVVAAAAQFCDSISIVVHAAGTQLRKPARAVTRDEWEAQMAVNLSAPYFLSCRLFDLARADVSGEVGAGTPGGRHIFLTSLTSSIGIANIGPYAASKAGVLGIVRSLAVEWAESGVTVNAVQPGYFHTSLTEPVMSDPERRAWIESRIPMGEVGQADDVAGAVVFLASDAARYITGQSITVDGGWLAS